MWDNSSSLNIPWKEILLSEVFELNHDQVFPALYPATPFVHYSIPSWDQTGGPTVELGEEIGSNKTAIYRPSVLVSKLNPRKPRVAPVYQPPPNTCCSTEFICYQPKRGEDDLRFWAGYFSSSTFSGRLAKNAIGSTNSHTRANPQETLSWSVPDVPQDEQQNIARILDTLDTTIRETEAIIAKLKAVKQGLLHDLLTRGLDDNGELRPPQSEAPHLYKKSKLGWIPKRWGSRKIEDCLIQIVDGDRGKNYPSESEFTSDGYCLFLNAKNVTRDGFKFEETLFITEPKDRALGSGKLERNDIIITTRGTIGNFGFFDDSITFEHMRVNSGMLILRNQDASINSVFLFLSLKNYIFPFELQTKGSGSAQPQLPSKDLKTFHILLPPIVEQVVIAEKIIKYEQRVAFEETALSKAVKLKSGLMDDLLTGRVRVTNLLNNPPGPSPEAAP